MTTEEEAKELVEKYKNIKINNTYLYPSDNYCKQCALICVTEKGKSIIWSSDFNGDKRRRLEEVKEEINKL